MWKEEEEEEEENFANLSTMNGVVEGHVAGHHQLVNTLGT